MPEHIYDKADLIQRFDDILNKTLEEIDTKGFFAHIKDFDRQKGTVGSLIEQCVLGYDPDTKQEADLIVVDGSERIKTELKSTGMVVNSTPADHYVAKEPMSITAVGIYDIAEQEFSTSHFWAKLEHMLLVYYLYAADHPVSPYEYRNFPVKGYEFHAFDEGEVETLRQDWEHVRALAARVVSHHPSPRTKGWREAVKQEYIDVHGELRRVLSYIDLAPKFPPRFRLKKPVVSTMIARHFGYHLEQLPGRYTVVSDIDKKCQELTALYKGKTISELAHDFGISLFSKTGTEKKAIAEEIVIAMFGGTSKKLNQIELFSRFGIVAKSVALTSAGSKTEDMKLFHIDFTEMAQTTLLEEDGTVRPFVFEDSALYTYFADHEFLCILFEEPAKAIQKDGSGKKADRPHSLADNTFVGFKRLVFSDAFIDTTVRDLWSDTRNKILGGTLRDVAKRRKDGTLIRNRSGEVKSAPNFLKGSANDLFIRGSGKKSVPCYKTEQVNGIRMLPQYVWIKGNAVIKELEKAPLL